MDRNQERWLFDEELSYYCQNADPKPVNANDSRLMSPDEYRGSYFNEYNQQGSFPGPLQSFQDYHNISRSQSISPSSFNYEIRRGRPLVQDGEHEPERIIHRRQYARQYRNKVSFIKSDFHSQLLPFRFVPNIRSIERKMKDWEISFREYCSSVLELRTPWMLSNSKNSNKNSIKFVLQVPLQAHPQATLDPSKNLTSVPMDETNELFSIDN